MKPTTKLFLSALTTIFLLPLAGHAANEEVRRTPKGPDASTAALAEERASAEVDEIKAEKKDTMIEAIQNHYGLTTEQIVQFQQRKMTTAQMIRASEISAKSGQPISAVLDLRFGKRYSWSKVTKTMNVSESDIRRATSAISRERKDLVKAIANGQQPPAPRITPADVQAAETVNPSVESSTKTTRLKPASRDNARGTIKDTATGRKLMETPKPTATENETK